MADMSACEHIAPEVWLMTLEVEMVCMLPHAVKQLAVVVENRALFGRSIADTDQANSPSHNASQYRPLRPQRRERQAREEK